MRPRWHNDHELLAAVAGKIHADNATRHRALFARKKITRVAAIEAVRVTFTISCSWGAIAALAPTPVWIDDPDTGGAWPYERRQMLSEAAEVARRAAEAMPHCFETVGFADAVDTLIWWERPKPKGHRRGSEPRRRAGAPRRDMAHDDHIGGPEAPEWHAE